MPVPEPAPQGALRVVTKLSHVAGESLAVLAGIGCAVTTLLVVLEAISRYWSLTNITLAEEFSGYLLAFVGSFGAASALRARLFPEVTYGFNALPSAAQKVCALLAHVVGIAVVGTYANETWRIFYQSLTLRSVSSTWVYTPLAIPQFFLFFGIAMLGIVLLLSALESILKLAAGARTEELRSESVILASDQAVRVSD